VALQFTAILLHVSIVAKYMMHPSQSAMKLPLQYLGLLVTELKCVLGMRGIWMLTTRLKQY